MTTFGPWDRSGDEEPWRRAEVMAAQWMRDLGFPDATTTPPGGDGGVDVTAAHAVAQVKLHAKAVQRPDVQRIRGVAHDGRAALVYSWSGYSKGALAFADTADVALFDVRNSRPVPVSQAATRLVHRANKQQEVQRQAESKRREDLARAEQEHAAQLRATEREQVSRDQAAERERLVAQHSAKAEADRKDAERAQKRDDKKRRRTRRRAIRTDRRLALLEDAKRQRSARQAARERRRTTLGADIVTPMRTALALGLVGMVIPFVVLSALAYWKAIATRRLLTSRGIAASPTMLRIAITTAVLGLILSGVVIIGSVDALTKGDQEELSLWAGVGDVLLSVGIGVVALKTWLGVPRRP